MHRSCPRLLIISDCAHGGTYNVATLLARGLRDDFSISLLAPFGTSATPEAGDLRDLGIDVRSTELSYLNLYRSSYARDEAAEILDATRPDLILCVDGAELSSLIALKTVARHRDIPYVIIINLLSEDALERFAPFLADSKAALTAAQAVVFVSAASRQRCKALLPDVQLSGHVIPNSVPDSFFAPTNLKTRRDLRRNLGVGEDDLLCLTAARIEERKGQSLVVAALGRLRGAGALNAIRWIAAGRAEAWDRRKLVEQIEDAGVTDRVNILGERDDICALLDASDVFVLTSYAEGMPLSIIEALAKGVPVIASGVDGINEQLDESCGVLLPSPAADANACIEGLARSLDRLMHDRESLARMGEEARDRARRLFHPRVGLARYRSLLTPLAGRARQRANTVSELDDPLKPGMAVDFARPMQIWNHLQDGWAICEDNGIWTDGLVSTLRLRIEDGVQRARLSFDLTPFKARKKSKSTFVAINGRHVATWRISHGRQQRSVEVDTSRTGQTIVVRFENPGATRPCDIGMGSDYRQLALFFHRLDIAVPSSATFRSKISDRMGSWFGTSP